MESVCPRYYDGMCYESKMEMLANPMTRPWTIAKKTVPKRNDIPKYCRWMGMEVWVEQTDQVFMLGGKLSNDDWILK